MPEEQLPWAAAPSLLCCSPALHTPSPLWPLSPSVAESFSQQQRDISTASCLPVGRPWLAVAGPGVRDLPQQPPLISPCGYYAQFNKYSSCALLHVCSTCPFLLRCGVGPVCMDGVNVVIVSLVGAKTNFVPLTAESSADAFAPSPLKSLLQPWCRSSNQNVESGRPGQWWDCQEQ